MTIFRNQKTELQSFNSFSELKCFYYKKDGEVLIDFDFITKKIKGIMNHFDKTTGVFYRIIIESGNEKDSYLFKLIDYFKFKSNSK